MYPLLQLSYANKIKNITRIYRELKKLTTTKKINNPVNKRINELDNSQEKKYKWPINR
jgi:hypothetical protein